MFYRNTCRSRKSTGFTLIELLVVIAIIAILAAILFPVFGRARENARKSSCQSNLKQISLGWMQYTQDYDEFSVPMRIGAGGTTAFNWPNIIDPYTKSRQILVCPSNTNGTGQSYAYSMQVGNFGPGRVLSGFPAPATTPMFADAVGTATSTQSLWFNYGNGTDQVYGRRLNGTVQEDCRQGLISADIHMDGANYAFIDGHVKWLHGVGKPSGADQAAMTACPPTSDDNVYPPSNGMDYNGDGSLGTTSYN